MRRKLRRHFAFLMAVLMMLSLMGVHVVVVAVVDAENREIVSSPEVVSRGFVYIKENTDLLDNVRKLTETILWQAADEKNEEWLYNAKTKLKDDLGKYIFEQTKRRPMILTVIKEI